MLLGNPVSDPSFLSERMVPVPASCMGTGFVDGISGADQWLLRADGHHRCETAVCSLFLYAGMRWYLRSVPDDLCHEGAVHPILYKRKTGADCIQLSGKHRDCLRQRISFCDFGAVFSFAFPKNTKKVWKS